MIFYARGCILRSVAADAIVAVVALFICRIAIGIATFRSAAAPAVAAVNSVSAALPSISAVIFCTRGCIRRSVAADAIVAVVALSICPVAIEIAAFRSAAAPTVAIVVNLSATAIYAPFATVFATIFSMAVAITLFSWLDQLLNCAGGSAVACI